MEDEATFKSALRPLSADDLPLIGRGTQTCHHQRERINSRIYYSFSLGKTLFPNLYIISGHGSKGWTLSFGSIRMMADITLGKETEVRTKDRDGKAALPPNSIYII